MRVTRGQGFDPRLGLLDYSGYERAAATRAQGMQQLSQSIGEAIKGYREERENEKFRDQFAQDLATKIGRKTPEGGIDENAAKELAYYNIDTVALEGLSPAEQFEAISAGLQGRDREELQKAKDVYALQDLEQRNLRSRIEDEQEFKQKQFESAQELQQKLANQEIKHRNELAEKDQEFRLKLVNMANDFEQTKAIDQHERDLAILTQEHENKMAQIQLEETALATLTLDTKDGKKEVSLEEPVDPEVTDEKTELIENNQNFSFLDQEMQDKVAEIKAKPEPTQSDIAVLETIEKELRVIPRRSGTGAAGVIADLPSNMLGLIGDIPAEIMNLRRDRKFRTQFTPEGEIPVVGGSDFFRQMPRYTVQPAKSLYNYLGFK